MIAYHLKFVFGIVAIATGFWSLGRLLYARGTCSFTRLGVGLAVGFFWTLLTLNISSAGLRDFFILTFQCVCGVSVILSLRNRNEFPKILPFIVSVAFLSFIVSHKLSGSFVPPSTDPLVHSALANIFLNEGLRPEEIFYSPQFPLSQVIPYPSYFGVLLVLLKTVGIWLDPGQLPFVALALFQSLLVLSLVWFSFFHFSQRDCHQMTWKYCLILVGVSLGVLCLFRWHVLSPAFALENTPRQVAIPLLLGFGFLFFENSESNIRFDKNPYLFLLGMAFLFAVSLTNPSTFFIGALVLAWAWIRGTAGVLSIKKVWGGLGVLFLLGVVLGLDPYYSELLVKALNGILEPSSSNSQVSGTLGLKFGNFHSLFYGLAFLLGVYPLAKTRSTANSGSFRCFHFAFWICLASSCGTFLIQQIHSDSWQIKLLQGYMPENDRRILGIVLSLGMLAGVARWFKNGRWKPDVRLGLFLIVFLGLGFLYSKNSRVFYRGNGSLADMQAMQKAREHLEEIKPIILELKNEFTLADTNFFEFPGVAGTEYHAYPQNEFSVFWLTTPFVNKFCFYLIKGECPLWAKDFVDFESGKIDNSVLQGAFIRYVLTGGQMKSILQNHYPYFWSDFVRVDQVGSIELWENKNLRKKKQASSP